MTAIGSSGPCPCLGRCDDPDNYFVFPTDANCCHSGRRPFPVDPSYQAGNCLGENWSECPRYLETSSEDGTLKAAVVSHALKAVDQFPIAWEFVVIAVVVLVVLIGVWFLVLRPNDASQAGVTTPVGAMNTARPTSSELGTAAAPAATQTPTLTPTLTFSPTTTPSRTPMPTTSPTATQEPTRTPSPTPTVTPTMTPSQTPSATPSLTPTPTRRVPSPTTRPTTTPTALPAPELLSPEDGQVFAAQDEIVLRWQSVGVLPRDAYYVVTVSYSHLGDTWYDEIPWTGDTSWALSSHDYLVELSDDGQFQWSVQMMQQTGLDENGKPIGVALSASSETWALTWTAGPNRQPTPTPPPP